MILSYQGKAHHALRYLAEHGPADFDTIRTTRAKGGQGGKVLYLLTAMTVAGWLDEWRGLYSIRKRGLGALAELDLGSDITLNVSAASVRVFRRAA